MFNTTSLLRHLTIFITFYCFSSAMRSNNLNATIVEDIEEFYNLHPAAHVEELELIQEGSHRYYSLGARSGGDSLVAESGTNRELLSMQNIGIKLTYPISDWAPLLTYVTIQVDQTSDFGRAYVVKGGLYQRSTTIVVEVYNTVILSYTAEFYGTF